MDIIHCFTSHAARIPPLLLLLPPPRPQPPPLLLLLLLSDVANISTPCDPTYLVHPVNLQAAIHRQLLGGGMRFSPEMHAHT
jgi:hypothetical protein